METKIQGTYKGEPCEYSISLLVIDDDTGFLDAICLVLADLGVPVLKAEDGQKAFDIIEEQKPAVIVLDLMLPKRGGFQVLQKAKGTLEETRPSGFESQAANSRKPNVPTIPPQVIMITGNEGERHREFAMSLGARAYIRKPFAVQHLVDEVRAAFRDLGVELSGK